MSLTYQELHAQYDALHEMLALIETQAAAIQNYAAQSKYRSLVFLGCGSSFDVARSAAASGAMRLDVPVYAIAGGDLWLNAKKYAKMMQGALVVPISRSGSTSEILNALEALGSAPAGVLSFSCVADSKLEKASGCTIVLPFAFDSAICQTRTVSCLYVGTQMLVAYLSGDSALLAGLRTSVQGGKAFLQQYEPACAELAKADWDHIVVLSDAELAGIGSEGALAFKEICQLPSNHYRLLDSRHGPMVLFGPKTLVIAALNHCGCERFAVEQKFIADVVAKGCHVAVYTNLDSSRDLPGVALAACFGEKLPHPARGLPLINLCQLLSYHKAAAIGVDPDKPAGLSAWIKI
jgi:fructoselysine-6-P-deglycase FrlB-like protein